MLNSSQLTPNRPVLGDSFLQILQQSVIFGEKRHDVLVGNVANIDTPTYKTRDLDTAGFQHALEAAIQARRSPSPASEFSTHPYLGKSSFDKSIHDPILAKPRNITFQDGNNRSIEQEMAELTKNLMRQSYLLQILSSQFNQLEAVISERP
jgi:flagellar basal-body rod protein FlgB